HAARCQDELPSLDSACRRLQLEGAVLMRDALHSAGHAPADSGRVALRPQHVDDLFGRFITEQLAAMLLVPSDAVAFDKIEEIARTVAGQWRTAEMGVTRNELCGRRADVGEVTAAAARDTDLLGELLRMVDEHPAQAAATRHGGRHHAGGAGSDDGYVETASAHAMASSLMQPT